ncbi:phage tail-collar fiber domain-containing protein [Providencia hangzhouensis]|uniref:phage tail-collar fiber domain-containing protein n=1 Tax=Providencia hangzhouensis TaxID=3031799 RepID=UPI003F4A6FEE
MASVITVAFEIWKAQEAASGKAVLLDEFVFANVPNLDPTQPIDRNEKLPPANQIVHRQAVNKAGLASENAVAYSVTLGAEVGNFDFNWIGLLNKASGTVAMITHAPTQKKLKTQNGQQGNVLTRSFILEFKGAAEETQIKTSAETWQIDFTARLSGIDEMQRLINVDSYGAAAFFNDGFEVTRSGEQYTVKKGLGYVGGLRGELTQNQILNGLRNTKVYADFSYQGNIVSQWNTVVKIISAATLNNYVDAAGFTHQVFAIASIDASGSVKDLRSMGALSSQEISALETRLKLDLSKKIDKANITHQMGNSTELVVSQQLLATELGKKQPAGNYAPAGDYATNTALNNGLNGKLDKTNVVQSTGASTTQVISQDAATKAFASKDLVKDIGYGQTALISPESKHQIVARDSGSSGLVNNTTGLHVWRFSENGTMTIGLIPVANGGTGAKTAPEARQNLSVYSKEESDLLAIPIGAGIEWDSPHIKPPSNFMAKEGQSFDKAANPELAKVYPDGKLPDRRGRFPRVLDNGKGLDVWSDRPIGSEQDDTLQKITGRLSIRSVSGVLNTVHDMEGAIFASDAFGGTRALPLESRSTGMQDSQFVNFDSSRVARSSNETKPKNYAMQFYVRVR